MIILYSASTLSILSRRHFKNTLKNDFFGSKTAQKYAKKHAKIGPKTGQKEAKNSLKTAAKRAKNKDVKSIFLGVFWA